MSFYSDNGNISRIDWGGVAGIEGAYKTRTYNYTYDNAHRLKNAAFSATGELDRFTVSNITHDANGNIYSMERSNQRAPSDYGLVDDLEYSYYRFSNRLSQVKDNNTSQNYTAKDFIDRVTTGYGYDDNGNMTSNADKQISLITYNYLNLPQGITFSSGAQLLFAYDAEGTKLTQKVYNTSGALTTTKDYIGEFVYQNGALDYLIHEEGRVVSEAAGLFYEYYLKDHLGNVRQVLRNATANARIATMEQANAEEEESQFTQIKPTRKREPRHNVTQGGQEVAWLNASRGEMVGPGTSQEIFEGDSVTLSVHGKFLDRKKQKVNLASFASTGGKTALLDQLNELALNTSRAGGANPIAILNLVDILAKDLQKKEVPEAYLIYALYDEDSNRYEVGKKVLSRNAANQHEELEEKLSIKKNGYIETFVVNETSEDVWFDNMMVMSISSVIVQETHYDPWGLELTGLGFQYGGIKANKYLYNGKELIEDNGLQYYDYGARMYDATIGRWGVIDPLAEKTFNVSAYVYGNNNPINFIDKDGRYAVSVHYEITYNALKSMGYSHAKADQIAHYSSTYADHPPVEAQYFDAVFHPFSKSHDYRSGIDYSATAESQDEKNSSWHSMMSDAEAANGMTEPQATARGLKFGWDNIFGSEGGKNLGKLGQGLHALQDAIAHEGAKTDDHLGFNLSSAGKFANDLYGSTKEASNLTKSALTVVNLLQGNKVTLKAGDTIDVRGMSTAQVKQVQTLLKEQGYNSTTR